MQLESAYLAALSDVRDHRGGGGELVLSGGEVRLVFREEEAPEPVPLVGTTWGTESLALATDAVASPVAGTEVTLEFLDDQGPPLDTGAATRSARPTWSKVRRSDRRRGEHRGWRLHRR